MTATRVALQIRMRWLVTAAKHQLGVRAAASLFFLLHEWMHVTAAAVCCAVSSRLCTPTANWELIRANIVGNLSLQQWLVQLLPFSPPITSPYVVFIVEEDWDRSLTVARISCLSAALFSVLLAACTYAFWSWRRSKWCRHRAIVRLDAHFPLQTCTLLASSLVALGSVWTDVVQTFQPCSSLQPLKQSRPGFVVVFCGNFGLLTWAAADTALNIFKILQEMASINALRGGQSGGIVLLAPAASQNCDARSTSCKAVRVRCTTTKRRKMVDVLLQQFQWQLTWKRMLGLAGSRQGPQCYIGHTRFATSSRPSVTESHPHQWSPTHRVRHWGLAYGSNPPDKMQHQSCLVEKEVDYALFVTHNGDFEHCTLFGREYTYGEMQTWLSRVLGVGAPGACDSVGIAGMLELLRTQGLWHASIRLAYQQVIVRSYQGAFGIVPPPTRLQLKEVAAVADAALLEYLEEAHADVSHKSGASFSSFSSHVAHGHTESPSQTAGTGVHYQPWSTTPRQPNEFKFDRESMGGEALGFMEALGHVDGLRRLAGKLATELEQQLTCTSSGVAQRHSWALRIGKMARWKQFAKVAVRNFVFGDMHWAMQRFISQSGGTFGCCAACRLDVGQVTMLALHQPMSISVFPQQRTLLYASDQRATTTSLSYHTDCPHPATRTTTSMDTGAPTWPDSFPRYLIPLNESNGTLCTIKLRSPGSAVSASHPDGWCPIDAPEHQFFVMRLRELVAAEDVTRDDFLLSGGLIDLQDNPYIRLQCRIPKTVPSSWYSSAISQLPFAFRGAGQRHRPPADLVQADLSSVAAAMATISASWNDRMSMNRCTAEALLQQLCELSQADSLGRESTQLDVLVTGIEVSLWVAEQFAADLKLVFPNLRILALSANKVIGVLGNARGIVPQTGFSFCSITGHLCQGHTVALCLSHSGETFPTVHATRILHAALPGRVFVVTGAPDSKMASLVGQRFQKDAPFCERVQDTHAGFRPAEAPTLSVMAMHHTLSCLLIFLAGRRCAAGGQQVDLAEEAGGTARSEGPTCQSFESGGHEPPFMSKQYVSSSLSAFAPSAQNEAQNEDRDHHNREGGSNDISGLGQEDTKLQGKLHDVIGEVSSAPPKEGFKATLAAWEKLEKQHEEDKEQQETQPSLLVSHLSESDIAACSDILNRFVSVSVPDICGVDAKGNPNPTETNKQLVKQGHLWSWHVLESPLCYVLGALYILASVISGHPLFYAIFAKPDHGAMLYISRLLDALLYVFLPGIVCLMLRIVQHRQVFARIGRRTVIIGDVPYVHQTLQAYVSKLFSLSYGCAGIDVASGNPLDHFVHRFTHRVTRGLLLAVGRPDGRMCAHARSERWVMLGLLQARVIHSLGASPEVMTIGHNPYKNPLLENYSITLPTNRPKLLCEVVSKTSSHGPVAQNRTRRSATVPKGFCWPLRWFTYRMRSLMYPPSTGCNTPARQTCAKSDRQSFKRSQLVVEQHQHDVEKGDSVIESHLNDIVGAHLLSQHGTKVTRRFHAGDVLHSQSVLEALIESRVLSAERCLSFMVLFYHMAARVAAAWPLTFDLSRSQSSMRIASTAAPVTASELEEVWREAQAAQERHGSYDLLQHALRMRRHDDHAMNTVLE